jgi:hypothetical protein
MDNNLKLIVEECRDSIDNIFIDTKTGKYYRFFGVVIGSDDYYYGMSSMDTGKLLLLSCVCNLDNHGFVFKV